MEDLSNWVEVVHGEVSSDQAVGGADWDVSFGAFEGHVKWLGVFQIWVLAWARGSGWGDNAGSYNQGLNDGNYMRSTGADQKRVLI